MGVCKGMQPRNLQGTSKYVDLAGTSGHDGGRILVFTKQGTSPREELCPPLELDLICPQFVGLASMAAARGKPHEVIGRSVRQPLPRPTFHDQAVFRNTLFRFVVTKR